MSFKYANARNVLPLELLKEVQKYHTGALWVPEPSQFYHERRQLVIALSKQGIRSVEIANLAGVTSRRVNQILAAHKKQLAQTDKK